MMKKILIFILVSLLSFTATDCKLGIKVAKVSKRFLSGKVISNTVKYSSKYGRFVKYLKDSGETTRKVCSNLSKNVTKKYKVVKRQVITVVSKSTILKEAAKFRKNVTWDLQYLKSSDVPLDNIAKQNLGGVADASVLKKNMYTLGLPQVIEKTEKEVFELHKTLFKSTPAHHVISGTSPAAEGSRQILKKFGVDINDGRNGIFLPNNKAHFAKGSKHGPSTIEYDKAVYERIKDCKTKEELLNKLDEIKQDLHNGILHIINQHEFIG